MEILEFNKEELQNIEDLLSASNVISSIYDKLYELEKDDKQDCEDYQKLLQMLQDALRIEQEKIKKANLNLEKCEKIFKLLSSSNGLLRLSNTECIFFQKYDDKVVRRIMSYLSDRITSDIKFQKEILSELFNISESNNQTKQIHKDINNNTKIQKAIINDMLSIFISILTEYISSKKYNQYKNELIKLKYYIAFINKEIEKIMLNSKFNPSVSTYISSNMTANLLGIDETKYNYSREAEARITAINIIVELLEIKVLDYETTEKNIESIIRQCYIRACLTLMSEDSVYDLNQNFHDLVESSEYLNKHPNDRISENAIIRCFKSQKHDRPRIRCISFRIPR